MRELISRAGAIAAVVTTLLFVFGVQAVQAQEVRAFAERFGIDAKGDVTMVGNVLLTCDSADGDCADIQDGSITAGNGNREMVFVNVDAGAGFANSSRADLALPVDADVLYAGLYWGARADETATARETVQFRVAGQASYQAINAEQLDTITAQGESGSRPYLAFADVTAQVQAAGNGSYFVAGMEAVTGNGGGLGNFGGWSLIVVYRDESQPLRRLSVFDGAATVSGSTSVATTVSGLQTPPSGAFDTFMGALVWEGDQDITGDSFELEGNAISDSLNPQNNFWNSAITRLDQRLSAKDPDFVNQLAMDIAYVDASGILGNNVTSANLEFVTSGDAYFPHALTFAVDLFAPDLVTSLEKTVVDLNGGDLEPGDELEYSISFINTGEDGATEVVVTDPIPANTTYVPGSLEILTNAGIGPTGVMSDAAGDDQAEFDGGANQVVFRLGEGATASDGGLVATNESVSVRFRVQVIDAEASFGETISNTATVDHSAQTLGGSFSGQDSVAIDIIDQADLAVSKIVDESQPLIGDSITFTIEVSNNGPLDATGVIAEDVLPSGYTFVSALPSQGNYDQVSGIWNIGGLANGAAVSLSITASVNESGDYLNSVSVEGNEADADLSNNSDQAVTNPIAQADLTLDKSITAGNPYADVGDVISYQLLASNSGNVSLFDVSISDPLLGSLDCTPVQPATLAPGESLSCTGQYSVSQADVDAGSVNNTATAAGEDGGGDPVSASDTAIAGGPTAGPGLDLSKALSDAPQPIALDSDLEYTLIATNTGNITLTNVVVSDPMISPDSVTCASVVPGDNCSLVGTYRVTQADMDAGEIGNTGTSVSDQTTDPIERTVLTPIAQQASLSLTKTASPGPFSVGELVDYSIVARNNGNITLTALEVDDPMISLSCNPATPVDLAPGEEITCAGSYQVTEQDVAAGDPLVNVATASSDVVGVGVIEASDDVTVTLAASVPVVVPVMDDRGRLVLVLMVLMLGAWSTRRLL